MDHVYQTLWDADMAGNGVPALRPFEPRDEARGFVVVDEPQNTPVGPDFRVLKQVHIPEDKRLTYDLCTALMNNYALERRAREVLRPQELEEETRFIEAILPTPVIQTARTILEERGGTPVPESFLVAKIRECWFDLGRSGGQEDASGFEHVFVGEQASKPSKIGGYHYWHKYWLDDGASVLDGGDGVDRMLYLGPKYGGAENPGQGVLVPEVVTLSMEWDAPAGDGGGAHVLSKPIGGFFVGCSPEGLIALGLVRALTESGKMATINGADYQLDLHRLDNARGIRTFFPRFIKAHTVRIDDGEDTLGGTDTVDPGGRDTIDLGGDDTLNPGGGDTLAFGAFRIVAAMINPRNPEGGREFVQIINMQATPASLANWSITAPNGTRFTLADRVIAPGEVFRFTFPRADGVLRNSGGTIGLWRPDGGLAQSCLYTSADTRPEGAPTLF